MKYRNQRGVISVTDLLIIGAGAVFAAILFSFFTERGRDAFFPTETGEERLFDADLSTKVELYPASQNITFAEIDSIESQEGSCGIVVESPRKRGNIDSWTIPVYGRANGCNWRIIEGSVGTVQMFDGKGNSLSKPRELTIFDNGEFQTTVVVDAVSRSRFGVLLFVNKQTDSFPREKISLPVSIGKQLR
ncbi:MAG: hypothetical protein ACI9AR_000197 [Flavobacteriaceae bacterium]|jgi:hypothetical protein